MAITGSTQRDAAPADSPATNVKARWVAVLGRRDQPTDGVEDYCSFLGRALADQAVQFRPIRVAWAEKGWIATLRSLQTESLQWGDSWAVLQYTTMAWSRRGFPFGAWIVLQLLRRRGFRCAVVFHEPDCQTGNRWVDRVRGACQDWVIRRLYSGADRAIFLDPLDKIRGLPNGASKARFVPIGANIPEGPQVQVGHRERNGRVKTVAVFCLSDPPNVHRELGDIAHAMRVVAQQGVKARVVFLGRGTQEARAEIERVFDSTTGDAVDLGLRRGDDIRQTLSESDAMLCVRGPLYMRRGSAIAGIACGLPIVGYAGLAEGTPLEEAGVELVPYLDRNALGNALAQVLKDNGRIAELRRKSITAQERHFSWDRIAAQVVDALQATDERTSE